MLASFLLSLVLFFNPVAHAGKLAGGFRGIPIGDPTPLKTAPSEGCVHRPEAVVEWQCSDKIGETPVKINYMVDEGVYLGVYITANGYQEKEALLAALKAAWGQGRKAGSFEGLWLDGAIYGTLRYNQYSGNIEIVVGSEKASDEVKRRKEERGKSAVNDL